MTKTKIPANREMSLGDCDARIAAEPHVIEHRLRRAKLFWNLGRFEEARADYLAVLALEPSHLAALNDLGSLLYAQGFSAAARTCYLQAIAHHPYAASPRVNLANLLLEAGDITAAREQYESVLSRDPAQAEAHQGMARILAELGDDEAAALHRARGFRDRFLTTRPYRGEGEGIPLLVLVAGAGGNIPTRFLIDDRVFRVSVAVADFFVDATALPPHALVFSTIGDADIARDALDAAEKLLRRTKAPVINRPSAVLATGRAENARRLMNIPDIVVPRIAILPRDALNLATLAAQGFDFPLLLRRPGFHAGQHFLKLDRADNLGAALAALPGEELTAIAFIDARGADGSTRKYRVMMIGGALYPMHLAIAQDWKVHYFTSEMAEHAEHRAEEAAFLTDMAQAIGPAAIAGLERICAALALDYCGIDFGLTRDGKLIVFEANATMVVNPPEPDPRWDYRRPAITRILDATHTMLQNRATVSGKGRS